MITVYLCVLDGCVFGNKNNALNPFLVPEINDEEKETGAFKNGFQSNQIKEEDNFFRNIYS